MKTSLPLPALFSQAFTAFTIEFDNEFEHQVPHRTTYHGFTPGFPRAPWLVSMAMWIRYMRHIPVADITAAELQSQIVISKKGLKTWLTRLSKWWGYLAIEGAIVRPTAGGLRAIEVWRTLTPLIEARWRERFGAETIDTLEAALGKLAPQLDPALPPYFAVLEYEDEKVRAARAQRKPRELTLPELLAKALLAFASEFDNESIAPLAACANILRVTGDEGARVRDLPRLTNLAALGVADAIRLLKWRRLGAVATVSRVKMLTIASAARLARDRYPDLAAQIEKDWRKRFGAETVASLRTSLEELAVGPLLRSLVPYPDGWRASLPSIDGLPHFPIMSHRGGFPDGS